MDYNYHTHTFRCHHATGAEEEYILKAIQNGIRYMGFADHAPFRLPNGEESKYRVAVADGADYKETLTALAEKYQDQIEIAIGFEMEYYADHFEQMLQLAKESGAEYLILGQHHDSAEKEIARQHATKRNGQVQDLQAHVASVIQGMRTGVYTYVAHPDVFNFTGDQEIYRQEMRKLCIAARELDLPLEINFLGIRQNRHYPNRIFWQLAGEERAPVVFGFDAHEIESAYDGESLIKAKEMVEKYQLNYIGKPNLRRISRCGINLCDFPVESLKPLQ